MAYEPESSPRSGGKFGGKISRVVRFCFSRAKGLIKSRRTSYSVLRPILSTFPSLVVFESIHSLKGSPRNGCSETIFDHGSPLAIPSGSASLSPSPFLPLASFKLFFLLGVMIKCSLLSWLLIQSFRYLILLGLLSSSSFPWLAWEGSTN